MDIASVTKYVVVEMNRVRITKERMIEAGCALLVLCLPRIVDYKAAKQDVLKRRT